MASQTDIMKYSGPTITIKSSIILNRLGENVLASPFVNEDHFFTVHPSAHALCYTLEIKWFFIQSHGSDGACFAAPRDILVNKGSVVLLKPSENGLILLHFPAESPHEMEEILLQQIDVPIDANPAAVNATIKSSHKFLNKLVSVAKNQRGTRGFQFPRAAMHEFLDTMPTGNSLGLSARKAAPTARHPFFLSALPAVSALITPHITAGNNSGGSGDMNKLISLLSDSGKPPQQQVSEGRAPKVPITMVKPAEGNSEALQCYKDIKLVTGLACLFQEILRVQRMTSEGRKQPYGITDPVEANLAMKENADIAYQVMHGGLGGYYDSINMYSRSYSKTVAHSEFKIEFTADIFKPFGFTKPALEEISGFLEQYISAIAKVKTDTSNTKFRNSFSKQIHQVLRINVGTEEDPVWVWQPKARLVYMHIDNQSYKKTVKTCLAESTTESFKFSMDYVIVEADINTENVERRKEKLNQAFDIVSDKMNVEHFVSQPGVANEVTDTTPTQDGM